MRPQTIRKLEVYGVFSVIGLTVLLVFGGCAYKLAFQKRIVAKVVEINNIQSNAITSNQGALFSSAILFQTKEGESISSTAEDRQWFILKKDQCVEARVFPYPFWNFEKAGSFYGARLLKIVNCW